MNYNKMIDHTVLKADTPLETVKRICDEAIEYGFASVCINPCHVAYCADYLKDSEFDVVETDVEKIAEHARMKQGA